MSHSGAHVGSAEPGASAALVERLGVLVTQAGPNPTPVHLMALREGVLREIEQTRPAALNPLYHEQLLATVVASKTDPTSIAGAATAVQHPFAAPSLRAPGFASHSHPSEAIADFVSRHGAQLDEAQMGDLRRLDSLPSAQGETLVGILNAFLDLDDAATRLSTPSQEKAGRATSEGLAARLRLAEAARLFGESLQPAPYATTSAVVDLWPYLLVNLADTDDTYTLDYHLLIDVGGDDEYLNNAGGTKSGDCGDLIFAAGLLDFDGASGNNDLYNVHRAHGHSTGTSCGKNGGSDGGFGFLFDQAGDDRYATWFMGSSDGAIHGGINGGGRGVGAYGFLLDLAGADHYQAGYWATNGGASDGGSGLLIDLQGTDRYDARAGGTNGGAFNGGTGMLIDVDDRTDNVFSAASSGTNGGASGIGSVGFLYGSGTFQAQSEGANGGGFGGGAGYLHAIAGTFHARSYGTNGGAHGSGSLGFLASQGGFYAGGYGTNGGGSSGGQGALIAGGGWTASAGSHGVNGGGDNQGIGLLVSLGITSYVASGAGSNGGGANGGQGALLDLSTWTSATYQGGPTGANGGGSAGRGFLIDLGGDDDYLAGSGGVNGGAHLGGAGTLLDVGGNDSYDAGGQGANGGANDWDSIGLLIDFHGDDEYRATSAGVNGGAGLDPATALLLDLGMGHDVYADNNGGTGVNKTVVPKGNGGAQVDA